MSTTNIFQLLTPVTYWLLIILWSFILSFYVKKMWSSETKHLFLTLIVILAIDAFRTLFESVYFGLWYTSLAGLIPEYVGDFLIRPELVFIPKLINLIAAIIVIALLLKRWLPAEEREKTQSKGALQASEEKFKAFTNQSVDGISVADPKGNYTYVNPAFCKMVGYTEEELLTMDVFQVTADSQDKATFAKTKGGGEGKPVLVVLKRKDDTDFLAEVVGKNITYNNQHSVLGVIRDVTDREQAEQERWSLELQVQHAQKLESLGVLAGGIAHDFNNLLTAILGNANLAIDELPPTSAACQNLHEIEKATKRAAELAKQMLAYSGRGQFVIQPVDVQKLVEGITHLLSVSISKKITIDYNFGEDVPRFDGDVTQIRQIVMNLFTNASEAIGDTNGVISLSTGVMDCSRTYLDNVNATLRAGLSEPLPAGPYTYIEVADTGTGMDTETLAKVFDPFFTTKFTGRGLGMSAVLGIVRGHHGALNVYSEVGKGTTFKVLFPVHEDSGAGFAEASSVISQPLKWHGTGTILIADDDESVRRVGQSILERLGFTVLIARDGQEALSVFAEHAADIVCTLLDLTMPHMDGEAAFREIKHLNPDAKVILCSGYNEQDATRHFVGKGLAGFIHKPYEMKNLRSTLRAILDDTVEPPDAAPDSDR